MLTIVLTTYCIPASEANLRIRVDDEVAVYSSGNLLLNTFDQGGSQYAQVNSVNIDNEVFVVKAHNNVSTISF